MQIALRQSSIMRLKLSKLVTDALERWLPMPELPSVEPTPSHLQDESLRDFQDTVRQVQEAQIEELLELYADVITNSADADSLDIEELLK